MGDARHIMKWMVLQMFISYNVGRYVIADGVDSYLRIIENWCYQNICKKFKISSDLQNKSPSHRDYWLELTKQLGTYLYVYLYKRLLKKALRKSETRLSWVVDDAAQCADLLCSSFWASYHDISISWFQSHKMGSPSDFFMDCYDGPARVFSKESDQKKVLYTYFYYS